MKEFEEKLEEEMYEILRYDEFKHYEKETKYSKQIDELELKLTNVVKNDNIVKVLNDYKYAIIQHVLIIQREQTNKMLNKGLKFGEMLAKNEKSKSKKDK